jgi:hypothetical protein
MHDLGSAHMIVCREAWICEKEHYSRCFEGTPAAAMTRLFLNFLFPLHLLQDGRFSTLRRFWMDSFFIYESGIKFLCFFSGPIFNVFIRIHTSNILPFRPLRALIFRFSEAAFRR